MFENSSNNQSNQPVDDIFAETDQVAANNPVYDQSGIVTRKVGLSSGGAVSNLEEIEEKKNKKGFLITVVIMVVIVIGLLGYLAYSKFMKPNNEPVETNFVQTSMQQTNTNNETEGSLTTNQEDENSNYSSLLTDDEGEVPMGSDSDDNQDNGLQDNGLGDDLLNPEDVFASSTKPVAVDSDGDGLSDEQELIHGTNPNLVDSDNDGLTDYEEVIVYGTNPLSADSDNDYLTDYEEVMIYKTDPLNPDTDGDGYLDGEEVKNGYNPLGEGLLPGNENR